MKINLANIKKAQKLLNKRECIAIPTETVYGIAGNAYSDIACKKIFKLKKRPRHNPLIVHYYDLKTLIKDCELNKNFLLELVFIFNLKSFLINLRKIIKYEKKSTCCMER